MILVTVGMHDEPFDRLVRAADEMASLVEEPVVIQRGVSRYTPTASRYFDFADEIQMQEWLSEARIMIAHGGAGTILGALKEGKPLVIAPRLRHFGEHFDDHQLELAEALAGQGRATVVVKLSAETLWEAVVQAGNLARVEPAGSELQSVLRAWLAEQAAQLTLGRWALFRWKHRRG
jgi:beta-1,4-N-acetylglucosaminyltransferase